eukprot:scaffold2330_cov136-Skeletonema_menzelii.AAC.8
MDGTTQMPVPMKKRRSTHSSDTSSYHEQSDASSISTASDNNSSSSCTDDNGDVEEDILNRLNQNDPTLTTICLDEWFPVNIMEWHDVGQTLGRNTHLTNLSILNDSDGEAISVTDEWALYSGLQHNRSIQILHFTGPLPALFQGFIHPSNIFWESNIHLVGLSLNGLEMGRKEMKQLSQVITTKAMNLVALDITHCWSRDGECFFGDDDNLFTMLLQTLKKMKDRPLKRLELQGNAIGSTSMKELVKTIQRYCPHLEELNLQDTTIGHRSCKALASLLRDPSSRLSSLDLWRCSMNDDCALILADALKDNKTLQFLSLGRNKFTVKGWKVFSALLCNIKSSTIVETFTSNHTLECLGVSDELLLVDLPLGLNLSDDKRAVAMNKVVKFHQGELLSIMGVKLLPNVMTCIGTKQKDSCHELLRRDLLSAMFSIVRNTPALFQNVSLNEGSQDSFDLADVLGKMKLFRTELDEGTIADLTETLDQTLCV